MSSSWSEAVGVILDLVSAHIGWEFPPTRCLYAEAGIRGAMTEAGAARIEDFISLLHSDKKVFDSLIERLLIYETYFFRDRQHFQLIRERWAQEMLALRGPEHVFQLWSAGCATGEEVYSLAMVIKELGLAERAHILGTDISRSALALAEHGVYSSWSLRESDAEFIATYFQPTGKDRLVLDSAIRKMVTLEYLNLNSDSYPSFSSGTTKLDLILCRNVAIYMSRKVLAEVSRRLFAALADGGWLIMGPSDPVVDRYAPFQVCEHNGLLYHRRSSAAPSRIHLPVLPLAAAAAEAVPAPVQKLPAAPAVVSAPPVMPMGAPTEKPAGGQPGSKPFVKPKAEAKAKPADGAEQQELRRLTLRVRALADDGRFAEAEGAVLLARQQHPVALEFIFLHMMILIGLQRHEEAAKLAGQLIFLDRTLAIAHFLRGTSLKAIGDLEGAQRAFENALRICAERPAKEPVALSEGENHDRLGQAAASQLEALRARRGTVKRDSDDDDKKARP